ncbi:hypothetical protein V6N13_109547 [Hibiscus sabdariffa]
MPPKRETRSGVGAPAGDQNVDAGVDQHDGLPPPPSNPPVPPIPHMGRGAGNAHQAPQGMNFSDMSPWIQAMTGVFQAAVAGANVRAPAPDVAVNTGLPLERIRGVRGVEFRGLEPMEAEECDKYPNALCF